MPVLIPYHEYTVVELNTKNPPEEMFAWLQVQFGPGDGRRWFFKPPKIYFTDPKDHMMFLLRYS